MSATTLTISRQINNALARRALVSTAAIFVLASRPLLAQDSTGRHGNWQGAVGMVGGSLASYYGSDARRTLGAPLINLVYKHRLVLTTATNGGLGAGAQWLVTQGAVGTALGVATVEARPEDRADALAGMDDRSGGAFATATVSLRARLASAAATTLVGLGSDDGVMQTLGLQLGGSVTPRLVATIGSAVTFADRKNMTFDFGVTEQQASRRRDLIEAGDRRLRNDDGNAFAVKGGLKEWRTTAQVGYSIHGAWQAVGVVSEGRLASDVAKSPLARKQSAMTVAAGLAYRF